MTLKFVDTYGFAGGFSCGATQAGMQLAGKRESKAGFGIALMEANRRFLGDDWESQAADPEEWAPVQADVVLGTPPCSAFSSMTAGNAMHGMHADINNCMRDIMRYAVRIRPQIIMMESVGQAFTKGLPLMRELTEIVRNGTGIHYHSTHVLQNNWSVGGASKRKRYFLVLSQQPFGVEHVDLGDRLPTLGDAIADLVPQPLAWEEQAYAGQASWYNERFRRADGVVDGHMPAENSYSKRVMDLARVAWNPGESEAHVLRRYYETHGQLPESWQYLTANGTTTRAAQLIARDFDAGGFSKPRHWRWDEPARVVNGAGPYMVWHPNQRFATHREIARIMGFPDDWVVGTASAKRDLHSYWGKGTSVAPARWISTWAKNSVNGNPGTDIGKIIDEFHDDRLIDVSMDWKPVLKKMQDIAA